MSLSCRHWSTLLNAMAPANMNVTMKGGTDRIKPEDLGRLTGQLGTWSDAIPFGRVTGYAVPIPAAWNQGAC